MSAQVQRGSLAQVQQLQDTLASVAERVRPSVVAIRADRRLDPFEHDVQHGSDSADPGGSVRLIPAVGSGVVIDPDGLILTNEHVIHNAEPDAIEVLVAGERYTARGLTTDPRSDLAMLRIDATGLKAARLGDLSTVRQGHFAIVMGNPFGSASDGSGAAAMSFGIISALGQDLTHKLEQGRHYGNLIQTDARINPGNSGGPLLNINGEVIGIVTAISTRSGESEGVGYAIAIDNRIKGIIARLAAGETPEYGYLGVTLSQPTVADRSHAGVPEAIGARIDQVYEDTPAAAAGLEAGDIVVAFGGREVADFDALIRFVGSAAVNRPVDLVVYRNGQRLTLTVTPSRRKEAIKSVNVEVPVMWRGLTLENATGAVCARFGLSPGTTGVVITYVEAGTAADKAGIRPGQVLLKVGDEAVKGLRRLREVTSEVNGPVAITLGGDASRRITLP